MLLADITAAVEDRYTIETIATVKMNRLIALAVLWYSRYNPYVAITSFDTVSEQRLYDLPDDCMQDYVIKVDYWPTGGLSYALSAKYEYDPIYRRSGNYAYDLYSERVIADITQAEYIKRVQGQWEIENAQIALYPVPGAGSVEVYVTYGAAHAINALATAYLTIPAEDLEIIRDLTVAEIIEGRRTEASVEPDYAEGLGRQTKRFIPGNVDATVKYLRRKCSDKYSGAAVEV